MRGRHLIWFLSLNFSPKSDINTSHLIHDIAYHDQVPKPRTSFRPWSRCADRDFPNYLPRTHYPGINFSFIYSGQTSEYSKYLTIAPTEYLTSLYPLALVPVAARSKEWVCWRSLGELVGSNPTGAWIFVCCECCVLSGRDFYDELITRPEESYRL